MLNAVVAIQTELIVFCATKRSFFPTVAQALTETTQRRSLFGGVLHG